MTRELELRRPSHFLASAAGVGLIPLAPGTAGSLLAYPLHLAASGLSWPLQSVLILMMYLLGLWACGQAERDLGRRDPPSVVWDEVVGCYLAFSMVVPADWLAEAAAFILFRFLDIVKPWPISAVQKTLKGGMGIMLDDLLAGGIAGLLVSFCYYLIFNKLS